MSARSSQKSNYDHNLCVSFVTVSHFDAQILVNTGAHTEICHKTGNYEVAHFGDTSSHG